MQITVDLEPLLDWVVDIPWWMWLIPYVLACYSVGGLIMKRRCAGREVSDNEVGFYMWLPVILPFLLVFFGMFLVVIFPCWTAMSYISFGFVKPPWRC